MIETQPANAETPAPASARPRLEFLDGLRGLSALYVVFHHMWQRGCEYTGSGPETTLQRLLQVFRVGHVGVDVFIVLSGFCLMLPVARDPALRLAKGAATFFQRRAKRILPPYYAAMVLGLIVIAITPSIRANHGYYSLSSWHHMPDAIVAHVLLVHNLSMEWIYRIDPPMWSVATEWQIYFLFPFLLLPLARKFGYFVPVLVGVALGFAVVPLHLDIARFWFIGLFAMGMWGAAASMKPDASMLLPGRRAEIIGYVVFLIGLFVTFKNTANDVLVDGFSDVLIGIGCALVLVACARAERYGEVRPYVAGVLSSRWAEKLGGFSYSLYLTHFLVFLGMKPLIAHHAGDPVKIYATLFAIGTPLALGFAYIFHLVFEKPFMNVPTAAPAKKAPIAASE
jgi:peptidoglycan/LPS O-acetylase OafA/YrhL